MALPDISQAERPTRRRQGLPPTEQVLVTDDQVTPSFELADVWQRQYPPVKGAHRWYVDTEACFPIFEALSGCKICLMVCPFNARSSNKDAFKGIAKEINQAKTREALLALLAERTSYAPQNPLLSPYLHGKEAQPAAGKILISGPGTTTEHGRVGMYLIRAETREEAEKIAAGDPFTVASHCTFDIIEWEIHQILSVGSFTAALLPPAVNPTPARTA